MRIPYTIMGAGLLLIAPALAGEETAPPSRSESIVDRLLEAYGRMERLSCHIRRETATPQGRIRYLSRVSWERGGRLHVDNASPVRRRIISDGETFYSYIEGDPRGFSRPVTELSDEMALNLHKVPGTATDILAGLKAAPETRLPPSPDHPVRAAYHTETVYAVLSLDAAGRLARVELFDPGDRQTLRARIDYSRFEEVLPGVAIPRRHDTRVYINGEEAEEIVRIDRLDARTPLDPDLFDPAPFFRGVEFVPSFELIYAP